MLVSIMYVRRMGWGSDHARVLASSITRDQIDFSFERRRCKLTIDFGGSLINCEANSLSPQNQKLISLKRINSTNAKKLDSTGVGRCAVKRFIHSVKLNIEKDRLRFSMIGGGDHVCQQHGSTSDSGLN